MYDKWLTFVRQYDILRLTKKRGADMETFLKEIKASEVPNGDKWETTNSNGGRYIVVNEAGEQILTATFTHKNEAEKCARQKGEFAGDFQAVKVARKVRIQQFGEKTAEGNKLNATFTDTNENAGYVVGYTEEWTAVRLNGERLQTKRLKDCRTFLSEQ